MTALTRLYILFRSMSSEKISYKRDSGYDNLSYTNYDDRRPTWSMTQDNTELTSQSTIYGRTHRVTTDGVGNEVIYLTCLIVYMTLL